VYWLLEEAVARFPDAFAVSFFGRRLRYRELYRQVEQLSRALAWLGVRRGDRVALILPNCPQFLIAFYAAVRIGAVPVGTNPLYTERELAHQLTDAGVQVAIVLDQFVPKVEAVREQSGLRTVVVTGIPDYLPFPISMLAPIKLRRQARSEGRPWPPVPGSADVVRWRTLMSKALPDVPAAEVDPVDDAAALLYTGGTTGLSKGAVLTHHNLVSNVLQSVSWFPQLRPGGEKSLCVLPMFHSYGLLAVNYGIRVGAEMILLPRFDLPEVLKTIASQRPTIFPGIPRIYIAINESPATASHDLSSIRYCFSAAAPLPMAVAEKFEAITGGSLVEAYGLTETSPTVCINPLDGRRKAGTVGLPVPDTTCRIVDPDDWTRELPSGREGELAVAGPQVMKGYWGREEETAEVIRVGPDGVRWLLTGDIARIDEDGYVTIVDRKKDMIIVSGFNVYPTEVEDILYRHPKIMKVCVVGVPDATTGEAVKAYIVLREGQVATAEEIVAFCRDPQTGMAAYRVPRHIEFRDSLPETLTGKVLRRTLLEQQGERAAAESR
jgi:long-chain acyl-CoA synthetase